jgi:ATP-dependent Clp protease adaptor protein ClpS
MTTSQYSHDTDHSVVTEDLVDTGKSAQIVVYNDDVNTFDWVIECFMEILQHSFEQAEQLSLLVHFKGKAIVKTDTYEALKPKKDALVDRGLSAVIEEFVP